MTGFVSYLLEIRKHFLRFLLAFALAFIVLSIFSRSLFEMVVSPALQGFHDARALIATQITSPLMVPLQSAAVLSLFVCMPYAMFEAWRFIKPALYAKERYLAGMALSIGVFLFYLGSAFAFLVVVPCVLGFISMTAPPSVSVQPDIGHYFRFLCSLLLSFGAIFEIPIVLFLLTLMGIVTLKALSRARPYVIIAAFVLGMLLTPPDLVSQCLLAIPVIVLYELGLLFARLALRMRSKDALLPNDH